MTRLTRPPWRSLLYVPAHQERFIDKAADRGADAIILDLEDGVPEPQKTHARKLLVGNTEKLQSQGTTVLVRINRSWRHAWRDLEAAFEAGVSTLLIPKVKASAQLEVIDEMLTDLEGSAQPQQTALIPLIESAQGLTAASDILRASTRLVAVIPGNEDIAAELGLEPTPETMLYAYMPLILAARAARVALYGLIGSGANFRDLEAYHARAAFAKKWGFQGATCVHPTQVSVLNEVFQASEADLVWARAVVAAFEAGGGEPTNFEGTMVDQPVYERARRLLP